MEVDITKFVIRFADDMHTLSSSVAESGLENIGAVTWENACQAMASESDWLTSDLAELQDHFASYGAWDRDELEAMTGQELNALLVQFVAGDYQARESACERGELAEWEECEGGRLYQSDVAPHVGKWFYYIGC